MKEFSTDINLDGLVAKYEETYSYTDHPPHLKHLEHFKFSQFTNQRGLFVFEFIGNGISSRAVIQKGRLNLISKSTIAGHFAFIIDENQQVCKGSYTGIFFDSNFYQADQETGRIIIPFSRQKYEQKAILINEGFAQLIDFQREEEQYQFNAQIILHNESIIMGNKALILIKPFLGLGSKQEPADLRLLEDTKITLQTINKIDNITISKTFDNIKFLETEEYQLEIQVPPNLAEINITVSTKVNIVTKGEKKEFSKQKSFQIENHTNDFEFSEAYLRNTSDSYHYILKGKNGESKVKVPITFDFYPIYEPSYSRILKTDKDGIINLGKLKNIEKIQATPRESRIIKSIKKQWLIPQYTNVSYSTETLSIYEDEDLILPFKHKSVTQTNFSLLLISQNQKYIENHFINAQIIINQANKYGINQLKIKDLKEGQYRLFLKKENKIIWVNVYKGLEWKVSKDFILTQRILIEKTLISLNSIRIDNIEIQNVQVEEEDQKHSIQNIKVQLGGEFNKKNVRIHAWAFQFMPNKTFRNITHKFQKKNSNYIKELIEFPIWENFYLSNRQLSDENRYVMERKQQEKTIGNFLEKPTVLLKRNLIQETVFKEEQLNLGTVYDQIEQSKQSKRRVAGHLLKDDYKQQKTVSQINGFQNFLQNSSEILSNIKVNITNQGAEAEFEMNLDNYSTLMIVAISDQQVTHQIVSFNNKSIPIRDISLSRPLDIKSNFTESRRTSTCFKYDKFEIEDITSTEMQIIDSLQKVSLIQKELKKLPQNEIEFIDNMFKWPSLPAEQRPKIFSDYCSHEFNLFLKVKDPQYFEQVVRPFLINKIEKTFVDYWLLDMDEAIMSFEQSQRLKDLNAFEQCLMISYLVKNGKEQRAKDIAQGLKERNKPPSIDQMNRIYDIVLNMNSLNSKPNQGEDILEQIKNEKKALEKQKIEEEIKLNMQYTDELKMFNNALQLYDEECDKIQMKSILSLKSQQLCDFKQEKKGSLMSGIFSKKEKRAPRQKEVLRECESKEENFEGMRCASNSLFNEDSFDQMKIIRQEQKLTFKELDNTKEYGETQYYKIKQRNESQGLITSNSFWVDFAEHLLLQKGIFTNFITSGFTLALGNLNEIALVLAILDFQFGEGSHGFKTTQGRGVEIKAASNMLLFLKEIQLTDSNINKDILVIHRYFEKDKQDKEVEEFLINEVYAWQIIVTNISNKNINFQALVQIPQGSLPLYTSMYQKSHNFQLNAFTTMQTVHYFYFPQEGQFLHFPTNVSINRTVIAKAEPQLIKVKKQQSQINQEDFEDILASCSIPSILKFMNEKNIKQSTSGFRFNDIYWLCKDQTFFNEGIKILKNKGIFDQKFWSYSIFHKNIKLMKEYFSCSSIGLKQLVGPQFNSTLLSVNNDDESHNIFNFLDYYPLVNARAHRLGGMDQQSTNSSKETKSWILNEQFRNTYKNFILFLTKKQKMMPNDRLMLVNYLLMQERIKEAIDQFKQLNEKNVQQFLGEAQLQFDYIKAYLDFYICGQNGSLEFKDAREIALKYKTYPIQHWKKLFKEIETQLNEIDECYEEKKEQQIEMIDNFKDSQEEIKRKQLKIASQMDFNIENQTIQIDYVNIDNVQINYYMLDLEILFSKTPFINQDTQDFSFIQPYASEDLRLDTKITNLNYPLPQDLAKKNLLIELNNTANGIKRIKTYYSALLRVRMIENFGELKAFIINQDNIGQEIPLPKTYIKVYSKNKSGVVKFFKDGYTDLRGRFDYASLSGTSVSDVDNFSVFISHDEYGSIIKEAKPPAGLSKKI